MEVPKHSQQYGSGYEKYEENCREKITTSPTTVYLKHIAKDKSYEAGPVPSQCKV